MSGIDEALEKYEDKKFESYLDSFTELSKVAEAENMDDFMRIEIMRITGMPASRFYHITSSALFYVMCSEPTGGASRSGRGSAVYYNAKEFIDFLMKLVDPSAQAMLLADCCNLSDEEFEAKYRGRSKTDVFNGERPIIQADNPCFNYVTSSGGKPQIKIML